MDKNQVTINGSFFIEWLVVCTITTLVGGMLAFATMWSVGEWVMDAMGEAAGWFVAGGLFGLLFGGGISAGQGALMRKTGISAGVWTGRSALAAATSMALGFFALSFRVDMENVPEIAVGLLIGLFLGAPLGLAQWRILRSHISNAGTWIVVSTLAPVVALAVGLPLSGEGREFLVLSVVGILAAAFTGIGMTWLLRRQTAVVF